MYFQNTNLPELWIYDTTYKDTCTECMFRANVMYVYCLYVMYPTISTLEHDPDIIQNSQGVRVVEDQQKRAHLGVKETTL